MTVDELATYLDHVRRGRGGLATHGNPGSHALTYAQECSDKDVSELVSISEQMPQDIVILKFGSRSVVGSYTLTSGNEIVAKYYYPRSLIKHLTYGIGTSRCYQSWIAGLALAKVGIPTPAPLAITEWRKAGIWLSRSLLVTQKAPGISLLDLVQADPENEDRFNGIAMQLKEAFSKMAKLRIVHGDMKATNIIIDRNRGDSISFIDLDATETLLSPSKWVVARAKDQRRFEKNWERYPVADQVFKDLF